MDSRMIGVRMASRHPSRSSDNSYIKKPGIGGKGDRSKGGDDIE